MTNKYFNNKIFWESLLSDVQMLFVYNSYVQFWEGNGLDLRWIRYIKYIKPYRHIYIYNTTKLDLTYKWWYFLFGKWKIRLGNIWTSTLWISWRILWLQQIKLLCCFIHIIRGNTQVTMPKAPELHFEVLWIHGYNLNIFRNVRKIPMIIRQGILIITLDVWASSYFIKASVFVFYLSFRVLLLIASLSARIHLWCSAFSLNVINSVVVWT